MPVNQIRILMLGDLIGKVGRLLFARHAQQLKNNFSLDGIIVNGENAADDGRGITPEDALFLRHHGADAITTGNHIWNKKSIIPFLENNNFILRPANLSQNLPGIGATIIECNQFKIGVINTIGRVFMPHFSDCPFLAAQKFITALKKETPLLFIDFHAQATAEKIGFAYYLDGKVTAVVGTHTHTQTNDARILPDKTAYITDLGMCGSLDSLVGFKKITQKEIALGHKLEPETKAPYILSGVIITADTVTGKAISIERIMKIDETPFDLDKEIKA